MVKLVKNVAQMVCWTKTMVAVQRALKMVIATVEIAFLIRICPVVASTNHVVTKMTLQAHATHNFIALTVIVCR